MKFSQTELRKLGKVLDRDHESPEAAAEALLKEAEVMVSKKHSYAVVVSSNGVAYTAGLHPSRAVAEGHAERIVDDSCTAWVLPVLYGTPTEVRKQIEKDAGVAEDRAEKKRAALRASINEWREKNDIELIEFGD